MSATNIEVSELSVAQGGTTELDRLSFKLAAGEARTAGLHPGVKLVLPKLAPQS